MLLLLNPDFFLFEIGLDKSISIYLKTMDDKILQKKTHQFLKEVSLFYKITNKIFFFNDVHIHITLSTKHARTNVNINRVKYALNLSLFLYA